MKRQIVSFVAGLLFAVGLVVGGMTDPVKVINFLDFAGDWDPSLALVMGGAILVYLPAFRFVRRWKAPLFDDGFHLPTRRDIDLPLVLGAALFGMGWGASGYCPGPALVSVTTLSTRVLVFAAGMVFGMAAFGMWRRRRA